jgi:fatty acid desaturase
MSEKKKDVLAAGIFVLFSVMFLAVVMEWTAIAMACVLVMSIWGLWVFFADIERAAKWARRMESDDRRNRSRDHGGSS